MQNSTQVGTENQKQVCCYYYSFKQEYVIGKQVLLTGLLGLSFLQKYS